MRILLVSNGYPPEAAAGVELHTQQLAAALMDQRQTLAVFCRAGDPRAPEFQLRADRAASLPVWRVNNNFVDVADYAGYYRQPAGEALFRRVLAEWQPDVIHFQHCLGLSAGLPEIARGLGTPAVLTLHDFWYVCPTVQLRHVRGAVCPGTHHTPNCFECVRFAPAWLGRLRRTAPYRLFRAVVPERLRLSAGVGAAPAGQPSPALTPAQRAAIQERVAVMRRALAAPHALTAPSQFVKDTYAEFGVAPERVRVVPLGLEVERWRSAAWQAGAPGALRLLYLGGRQPHKGIRLVLDAFRRWPGANHRLALYGVPGLDARFAAQVDADLAADPRAAWRGSVPHAALPGVLAEADVLLAPALWPETFSFVVREALLAGVWVIASDLGVMQELIQPGRNGWLAPPGDAAAWTRALGELAQAVAAGRRPAPAAFPILSHTEYAAAMVELYAAAREGR
ncbi:MAG: glycosyltransferase [Anaerolineales bacterium]|nr:glycosyltransferase [Anaerolineales bacterium]